MDYVYLVILLALVEYAFFIIIVGFTRGKYGVEAPKMSGNEEWERLHRVQANTTEQLILFIPAVYAFAHYVSPVWAAGIGCVYLVGRVLYFVGYTSDPGKRSTGAILSAFPSFIMILGALAGLLMQIL